MQRIVFGCLTGLLIAAAAAGQTMPGVLKMVTPYAPGGIADIAARLVAEEITRTGATVVVENRPGAGSIIGTEAIARAPADGGTVLVTGNAFLINPLMRKLAYDPFASFAPVCYLLASPQVIVVNSASPYRTMADILAAARAKPGELSIGANGPATTQHVAAEMIKAGFGVQMIFVPYPGGGPAVTAILGSHVSSLMVNYSGVAQHIARGQLRPLATTAAARIEALPDVPTLHEAGLNFDIADWIGILAPRGVPAPAMAQLIGMVSKAIASPALKDKLLAQQIFPTGGCGAPFGDFLRRQSDTMARALRAAGIRKE